MWLNVAAQVCCLRGKDRRTRRLPRRLCQCRPATHIVSQLTSSSNFPKVPDLIIWKALVVEHAGEDDQESSLSPTLSAQSPQSPPAFDSNLSAEAGEMHGDVREAQVNQADDENEGEDPELARRQALAARMAAMGGMKIGGYVRDVNGMVC
jgi:hypothetical protein